ncbi:MAG: membrane protein insertion efficiency factor YidD [Clostridiaceae bacterium]|nr:membrane protein insertion efficiency factor YidD [Clostridiaceae bacterium]
MLKGFAKICIMFYKRFISPSMKVRCAFTPTCSMYTLDAITKHGFFKGGFMGLKRILRCNGFTEGGFDPVPENYRGKLKWIL